ncbi:MAG: hypothetical protein CMJ64_13130 [Planctomycetaceae bacterium]|nr:hypothetical protein [Planctomycetaceae bacterium]
MKTKQHFFVLAAIVGVFLWFFGAVLFQDRSFGFRDSANYYYPLFEWETSEWAAGRIPLWNPLDDTGTPVLADTTSSVLYPGKLVFALPVSYRLRYHLYVTMHVLLASAMAYALARRWQASVEGAGLAALAYAFGGSVVFQYCNVVFLVGAAWLPAALVATDWMLARRSLVGAVALGAVLALMTLGGDPQASYHAGLLAALYAWFSCSPHAPREDRGAAFGTQSPVLAAERRQQIAWVVSPEYYPHFFSPIGTTYSSRGCKPPESRRQHTQSPGGATYHTARILGVAPPGLGCLRSSYLGLTPQAIICRRSAAENVGNTQGVSPRNGDESETKPRRGDSKSNAPQECRPSGALSSDVSPQPGAHAPGYWLSSLRDWYRHPIVLLACAACSAFLLAAVQILPAMEATARSDRAAFDEPRSLAEMASCLSERYTDLGPFRDVELTAQIFDDPSYGTHLRHVYHFSVGPWHVADFVWPNVFGKPFPRNERWISALPAEGRTWTPSLYLGLLPLLLAAMMLPSWRADWRVQFLVVVGGFSLVGSFGWYGLGWIIHELRAAFTGGEVGDPWIGNPVGGLYWLLVELLPGYVMFRYPAKLLVLTSLVISLLAARGWDRFVQGDQVKLSRVAMVVAGVSLALAAAFGLSQPAWRSWLADAPPDAIFGPIGTDAATSRVLTALAHTAAFGLLIAVLLKRLPGSSRRYALLAMTAIELCVANGWMTESIDAEVWRAGVATLAESGDAVAPPRLFRDLNAPLLPAEWSQRSGNDRLDDVVLWERSSLLPRHHLSRNIAMVGAHTTLRSLDTAALLRVRQQYAQQTRDKHTDALLAPLSVSCLLVAAGRVPVGCENMNVSPADGVELWYEPRAYPRVWLASKAVILDPLPTDLRRLTEERTRAIYLEDAQPRDLRSVVFIEAASNERLPTELPVLAKDDYSTLIRYGSQRVEIEVRTSSETWLVLNDAFFPGWEATRETNGQHVPVDIYRANRLMRAVLLPSGEHRVEFVYRPRRFWTGAFVSALSWMAVAVVVCWRFKNGSPATTSRKRSSTASSIRVVARQ